MVAEPLDGAGRDAPAADRAGPPLDGADAIADAWRRELPGVPVDSIGVITRVWWAAKLFGKERRRTLHRLGIDMATLDLLSTLRRSGPPYRMSPSELATACLVSRGAITQRVARAVRAGLVEKAVSASGYHARAITLTAEGHRLVESAVTGLLEYEQRLLDGMSAPDQERLADLMRVLLTTIGERAGPEHLGHAGEPDDAAVTRVARGS